MTSKAVLNKLTFAVYITKEHLEILMRTGTMDCSAQVGGVLVAVGGVRVTLSDHVRETVGQAYAAEKLAYEQGRLAWREGHLIPPEPKVDE